MQLIKAMMSAIVVLRPVQLSLKILRLFWGNPHLAHAVHCATEKMAKAEAKSLNFFRFPIGPDQTVRTGGWQVSVF